MPTSDRPRPRRSARPRRIRRPAFSETPVHSNISPCRAMRGVKVYVLRHEEAAYDYPNYAGDRGRPLTERGRRQSARTAGAIRRMGLRPDVLASSPLVRAVQTAEAVSKCVGAEVQLWTALQPERRPSEALDKIWRSGADSIMVVGHEPHLTGLIRAMISGGGASISLKKGALAYVRLLEPAYGELRYMLTPKQMGMISPD